MPAPIAPLIGFALGALFAWAARRELGRARAYGPTSPMLVLAVCYALLVFAPLCGYFLVFVPDWCFAYLVDPRRLPRGFEVACSLANAASVPLGFAVATRAAAERSLGALGRVAGPPALLSAVFLLAMAPRLTVHASYAQFHGDFGVLAVAGSSLGYSLLWMACVFGGSLLWMLHALGHMSHRSD